MQESKSELGQKLAKSMVALAVAKEIANYAGGMPSTFSPDSSFAQPCPIEFRQIV
jgi:hypothetical protein